MSWCLSAAFLESLVLRFRREFAAAYPGTENEAIADVAIGYSTQTESPGENRASWAENRLQDSAGKIHCQRRMGKRGSRNLPMLAFFFFVSLVSACNHPIQLPSDDAKARGLSSADLPELSADVFKEMDGGIQLTDDEVRGRNTWILWTAGNQVFWDRIAREGFGLVDLLKTLDSRKRPRRFAEMGLINEPGFQTANRPDVNGLWLDERIAAAPSAINEGIYGQSSGVMGLRIYPNPDFDDGARKNWDPDRYYKDPSYYENPRLVRPYRVGITCGLCHVAPNPLNPPSDPENPNWQNLASAIGNQYLREGRVFVFDPQPNSFFWQMLAAQPPGTSDTSRVANDHLNNPGAINAIFDLDVRLDEGVEEKMAGGALSFPGAAVRKVPHILKDGADSVGAAGAMMRVYVNEGLYSQEWLKDHDLLLGFRAQRPFPVSEAFRNSVYWQATYDRVGNIAKFFTRLRPMHLADAPGGSAYLTKDQALLNRGKIVFAEHCAECHSSKQPPANISTRSPEALEWYRGSVTCPDFREGNFLSNDRRYPVTLVKTNACRALATNATAGHIWDNFSSETYKSLKPVGVIEVFNPMDESKSYSFSMPAGGPGYYRPPSLISMWSSAPYFHNNSLGVFTGDPSVEGRMRAFNDAIEKLLWPEKRDGKASIWITTEPSFLKIPESIVPQVFKPLCKSGFLDLGPIPKGTPINLIMNIEPDFKSLVRLLPAVNLMLAEAAKKQFDFLSLVRLTDQDDDPKHLVAALMSASKCPDLIENRGHQFGANLPDSEKRALIEFLKTL